MFQMHFDKGLGEYDFAICIGDMTMANSILPVSTHRLKHTSVQPHYFTRTKMKYMAVCVLMLLKIQVNDESYHRILLKDLFQTQIKKVIE